MPEDGLFAYRPATRDTRSDTDFDFDLAMPLGDMFQTRETDTDLKAVAEPTKWEGDVPPDMTDAFDFLL